MTDYKCDKCNKEFSSEEALNMHNKSKHPELYKEPKTQKSKKRTLKIWISLIIIALMALVFPFLINKEPEPELEFKVPRGPIHWHPHLTILINNEKQYIPANIGLGSVHLPLHTHEDDGTIHMEINRPTKKNVLLGYFFEVWGKTFNKNCIFDYCTDKGTLKMYVNGKENLDFENYFMHDKDEILIEYNFTKT